MILAVDPGGTTGLAYVTRDLVFGTAQVPGGFEGLSDFFNSYTEHDSVQSYVPWEPLDAVVCETFVPRPGAKSTQLDAMWLIGVIKHLCRHSGVPLAMQSPTQAKSFAGNDKLKAAGWYSVGEDHGRDAARHLLTFLCGRQSPAEYAGLRDDLLRRLVEL